jgi:hypothetical protein
MNRLVPMVAEGRASVAAIAALAAEEMHIVPSDRRSFLVLAARSADQDTVDFFTGLAQGETQALAKLPALAAAAGMNEVAVRAYRPRPGCQAYPSYVAWLALNGDPAQVRAALLANFAAWGGYCATLAGALRRHYGFDDEACAFFDFFASDEEPGPQSDSEYARMLQAYEEMFWNTLADDLAALPG